MADGRIIETVAIDTQVFVATGFGFSSKIFQSFKNHLVKGRLRLVMTDITVREVHARIRDSVTEELVAQRSFVNRAHALFNSSVPEVKVSLKKLDPDVVARNLCDQFDAFLKDSKATILPTTDLIVGEVFDKYFSGKPPFGDTERKRYEFPDAFAIQALEEWAEANDVHMFVVSGDKPFQNACRESSHLCSKGTLSEVLDHVASDDALLADFVRKQTVRRMELITKSVKEEFEDRYYWVEDEDGDAQVQITKLVLESEPEIILIDKEEAILDLSFEASYTAELSYKDSTTAIYDSEDKAVIYVDTKEEAVKRGQYLAVEVQVSYEDRDPDSFDITDVSIIEPSDGFGIETQENHDWPYK